MKSTGNPWLDWARELQFLSQSALTYCRDVYDIERFERIRAISAEMFAAIGEIPVKKATALFCNEVGYQTPKLDTRAAILRDGRIALVQEQDGLWAMPGGWCDYNCTIRENAEKEAFEEAGMTVRVAKLVALYDHNRRNLPPSPWEICSAHLLCEYLGGDYVENAETVACGWFAPDALPELNTRKTTAEQIMTCFEAANDPHWQIIVD